MSAVSSAVWRLFAWSMAAAVLLAAPSAAQPLPRSVLILDQYAGSLPWVGLRNTTFRTALNAGRAAPISIYEEFLDFNRFASPSYRGNLKEHLGEKYRDKPIGLIVAFGPSALDYAVHIRDALWPGTSIVFGEIAEKAISRASLPAGVTGTTISITLAELVVAARALIPDLEGVALVGDSLDQLPAYRHFKEEIPLVTHDVDLIDLTGLTMVDLRRRVMALPDRTAIIYTTINLDRAGVSYVPAEALSLIAEVANRPIVVSTETFVGRGAVGGFVVTPAAVGQDAARLAARILDGADVSALAASTNSVNKPVFDWRELRRWGISESQLPQGSEIRFREPTLWQQYRGQILAVWAVVLAQAAMIAWLLNEQHRRRRSEAAAHELSGLLIKAQEEERSRLARELHDDVTQRLAVLAIEAGREERKSAGAGGTMRESLVRLSDDVHALSYRLHPSILADLGLREALRSECEHFSQISSFRIDLSADGIPDQVPHDVGLCLYRIVQESLRNIARHASASRAGIRLRQLDGGLQLTVRDNGVGFDAAHGGVRASLGLASMRQRVALLGGKLRIDSKPREGTTVWAWVPFEAARA